MNTAVFHGSHHAFRWSLLRVECHWWRWNARNVWCIPKSPCTNPWLRGTAFWQNSRGWLRISNTWLSLGPMLDKNGQPCKLVPQHPTTGSGEGCPMSVYCLWNPRSLRKVSPQSKGNVNSFKGERRVRSLEHPSSDRTCGCHLRSIVLRSQGLTHVQRDGQCRANSAWALLPRLSCSRYSYLSWWESDTTIHTMSPMSMESMFNGYSFTTLRALPRRHPSSDRIRCSNASLSHGSPTIPCQQQPAQLHSTTHKCHH